MRHKIIEEKTFQIEIDTSRKWLLFFFWRFIRRCDENEREKENEEDEIISWLSTKIWNRFVILKSNRSLKSRFWQKKCFSPSLHRKNESVRFQLMVTSYYLSKHLYQMHTVHLRSSKYPISCNFSDADIWFAHYNFRKSVFVLNDTNM